MDLWTAATPNGWKVTIMVEELIEAGIDMPELTLRNISLTEGEQFSEEFTRHNPNQKIPVLIDGDVDIMESCAILQYLGEKYPSDLFPQGERRWEILPWLYWQAANVGPVFGNRLSYTRYMDDVDDAAKAHPLGTISQGSATPCLRIESPARGPRLCLRRQPHHRRHRHLPVGAWLEVEQDQHDRPAQCHGLDRSGASETCRGPRPGIRHAEG